MNILVKQQTPSDLSALKSIQKPLDQNLMLKLVYFVCCVLFVCNHFIRWTFCYSLVIFVTELGRGSRFVFKEFGTKISFGYKWIGSSENGNYFI